MQPEVPARDRPAAPPPAAGADRPDALVVFQDVEKTYDGRTIVVRRLNLSVRRGEFLTLLGPSGSGKTTSLMMLAGFETPTSGSILLDGRPIEKLPAHKRNIGVVFQNYALFPHMTVEENIAFPLQMRGVRGEAARERIARALGTVRMQGFATRKPAQLSGGQQQRIALARALVFEPSLVLMDEPLGALDKQLREHMQLEIKHLHERLGITVVYVTHDQGEALTMSDRIAVFNDGVVQQLGAPADIYGSPATPFVAQFVGDNNAVRGRVVALGHGRCTVALGDGGEGARVEAVPVKGLAEGSATTLSIRPECIRIGSSAGGDIPATTDAEVREVIYHGDHVRVRVAAFGTDALMIKVPHGAGSGVELAAGSRVPIGWKPEDCHALHDDARA